MEPKVYLPDNVNTIVLANRSLTPKEDKTGKIIESVVSGEMEVSDRKASEQCLKGVFERFLPGHFIENRLIFKRGKGADNIDAAIEWGRKAYVDYNVKVGRDYEYALRNL